MKNKFYLILPILILILSACDEKHKNDQEITKEKQINKELLQQEVLKKNKQEIVPKENIVKVIPKKTIPKEYYYEFKNLKEQVSILSIKNDIYNFKNIKQSIVIVNIMSTWCPPCRGQIPHLSKLQHKFKENIFVMSMLIHDDISTEKLNKFIIAEKILYYVSVTQNKNADFVNILTPKLGLSKDFPMPLTLVFVRGKYFTHYEGMIPEEMIESDINQLLEKIKN